MLYDWSIKLLEIIIIVLHFASLISNDQRTEEGLGGLEVRTPPIGVWFKT